MSKRKRRNGNTTMWMWLLVPAIGVAMLVASSGTDGLRGGVGLVALSGIVLAGAVMLVTGKDTMIKILGVVLIVGPLYNTWAHLSGLLP